MAVSLQEKLVTPSRYVAPLTGIRAIAALLILLFHITYNLPSVTPRILPFLRQGYLGVDIFFVLSGFIITHVYWEHLATPSLKKTKIYLWHRLVRIYPVHITVLLVLMIGVLAARAAGITLNHPEAWRWQDVPKQAFLLGAWSLTYSWGTENGGTWNTPAWSISAEWFVYVLFPVIAPILLFARGAVRSLAVAAGALGVLAVVFTFAGWPLHTAIGISALIRVVCEFICGAALCRATVDMRGLPRFTGDALGISAFLIIAVCASTRQSAFLSLPFVALAVWGSATAEGPLARLLSSTVSVWFGEISYSIYMVHQPVLLVLRRGWERAGYLGWPQPARMLAILVTIAIVVLVAATMFYLVEWPVRARLRDRFGKLAATRS
jgi:peptidoglycan/LPS O-acetylase OafA/YrhL